MFFGDAVPALMELRQGQAEPSVGKNDPQLRRPHPVSSDAGHIPQAFNVLNEDHMDETSPADTVAGAELRQLIERIERLEEERKALADDVKDVMAEAKGRGYDTKAIRAIIRLRKKDQAERQEEEAILDLYKAALGMA